MSWGSFNVKIIIQSELYDRIKIVPMNCKFESDHPYKFEVKIM